MVLLAILGYIQGQAYDKYGKHPEEMLLYTHLLPLPMFMLFGNESSTSYESLKNLRLIIIVVRVLNVWSASAPISLLSMTIPIAWIYLLINCVTQYFCISGVHHVTGTPLLPIRY